MALPQELLDAISDDKKRYASDDRKADDAYDAAVDKSRAYIASLPDPLPKPTTRLSARDMVKIYQQARENAPPGITVGSTPTALLAKAQAEQDTEDAQTTPSSSSAVGVGTISSALPAPPMARDINAPDPQAIANRAADSAAMRFGTAGIDPASTSMAQSAFADSQAGIKHEQAALNDSLSDINVAAANREAAAQTRLSAEMAKNDDLQGVYDKRAQVEKQNAVDLKAMYDNATAETTGQMTRVRQAADEAGNAQIKDFWEDKSVPGRIIGIISQALAGAANGLSGQPGAPTPLDRIIQADLEKQRMNLNNKNVAAQREEGILGTMQRQFDSNIAAHGAAYLAAISHTDALAKQIAQKYATPEAMSVYQQFHADNLEKNAQVTANLHGTLLSSNLQQNSVAAQLLERQSRADAAVKAAEEKALKSGSGLHLLGIKGDVKVQEYGALQEHAQATATSLKAYEGLQKLMASKDHITPAWINEFNLLASEAFAARRIDQQTGARLEGKEAERVEAGVPKLSEGFLGRLTRDGDILKINKQLGTMIRVATGQYGARAQAVTGKDLDYTDPIIGPHFRAIATRAGD